VAYDDIAWQTVPGGWQLVPGLGVVDGEEAICPIPPGFQKPSPVVGFDIKSEPYQGSGDDSALNGIVFYCSSHPKLSPEAKIGSLEGMLRHLTCPYLWPWDHIPWFYST